VVLEFELSARACALRHWYQIHQQQIAGNSARTAQGTSRDRKIRFDQQHEGQAMTDLIRRYVGWKLLRLGWVILPKAERHGVPSLLAYAWMRDV
jgi:hypothetical protein